MPRPEPEDVEVTGQNRWVWRFSTRAAELAGHLAEIPIQSVQLQLARRSKRSG